MIYDSIVIGKGPAGIQASLYIKRANLEVIVIGKDCGALSRSGKIENFYGQEESIFGNDLVEKGVKQAERLGIQVLTDEVVSIEFIENQNVPSSLAFSVKTLKNEYKTKTVIIATGANRQKPMIKGVKEFEGHGVSYCAVCDGFLYKNKEVAVIGDGDYAISEIEALLPITHKITILTNGKKEVLTRDKNIECNTKEIAEIVGDKNVEKVIFKDNSEMKVSGIFVAEGIATSIDLARRIGAIINQGILEIDNETMQTSIPGMFVAGDCTGGIYQIPKAVYEGMKSAFGVIKYLKK